MANKRVVFLEKGDVCPNTGCKLPIRDCRCSTAGVTFIKYEKRQVKVVGGQLVVIPIDSW